jgi:hypothetical protein
MTAKLGNSFSQSDPSSHIVDGSSLACLRDYRAGRESSYDRTGANADWIVIPPGTAGKLGEIEGPGMITHIWIPFGTTGDRVRREVLRIYWDGEREPSVEVPVQDFFGLALAEQVNNHSALISAAPWNGLNVYFPMPFARSARITMNNDDKKENLHIYCHIDYVKFANAVAGVGNFHAQYRQHVAGTSSNGDDSEHLIFEAEGRGHLAGLSRGIVMGSRSEIYNAREYLYLDAGDPLVDISFRPDLRISPDDLASVLPYHFEFEGKSEAVLGVSPTGRYQSYRWFVDAPPPFQQRARASIKVAGGKSLGCDLYTVAYWYQSEPHKDFPKLPTALDHIPRSLAANHSAGLAGDSAPITV